MPTETSTRQSRRLRDEYSHRNLIAHRGADRIDGTLLRSIQTKVIGILKDKT